MFCSCQVEGIVWWGSVPGGCAEEGLDPGYGKRGRIPPGGGGSKCTV